MKTLVKHISVGTYEFDVRVDRHIVAECFEQFPDLIEFLLKNANGNETDIIIEATKNKKLVQMLDTSNEIGEFVKFALPKMLTDEEMKADEILDYIYENEVDEVFNTEMFKFICSGFTPDTAEKKPKVKFTMK